MSTNKLGSGESSLETGISYVLIIGVILSLILEVIGLIMYRSSFGNLAYSNDASMYIHGTNFFAFLVDVFTGKLAHSNAIRVMIAGIAVLHASAGGRCLRSPCVNLRHPGQPGRSLFWC